MATSRARPTAGIALAVLALAVGPLGLIRPQLIRPIYVGWMVAGLPDRLGCLVT